MLDINEIEWAISKIEKQESSDSSYVVLAALYIIRDRIRGKEKAAEVKAEVARTDQMLPERRESYDRIGKYSQMGRSEIGKQEATEWVQAMKNEDGTTGPHWTLDQAKKVMAEREISGSPISFWVTLCMMYSDYCLVARKIGMEKNMDFYVWLAEAFLNDKDSVPDKLDAYYRAVVKH